MKDAGSSVVIVNSFSVLRTGKQSKMSGEHLPQMFQDPAVVKLKVSSLLSVTCSIILHNLTLIVLTCFNKRECCILFQY